VGHEKEQQPKQLCLQTVIYYMEHSVTGYKCGLYHYGVLGIDVFTLSSLSFFFLAALE
jgi:hypothetical protein